MRKTIFILLSAASAALADIPDGGFDRYQVILNRKPFGELPPPEVATVISTPADSFAKSLRLCTIIDQDDGTIKIGFVDTRTNKSYLLGAGESEDGIEVVSANFDNEEAIVRQGTEMALINLKSGEPQTITADQQAQRVQEAQSAQSRPSYEERRRLRAQAEQPPQVTPQYSGEELQKHLYEYQMEVIRQGLPPLPIPLTPEQDSQLVKEGYLPPQN